MRVPDAESAEATQKLQKTPTQDFSRILRCFCAFCVRLSEFG